VGCDGHGVRWQGAKKYNNQPVLAVARHAVWLPWREVATSNNKKNQPVVVVAVARHAV